MVNLCGSDDGYFDKAGDKPHSRSKVEDTISSFPSRPVRGGSSSPQGAEEKPGAWLSACDG